MDTPINTMSEPVGRATRNPDVGSIPTVSGTDSTSSDSDISAGMWLGNCLTCGNIRHGTFVQGMVSFCVLATIAIFLEELIYLWHHFRFRPGIHWRTLYLLGLFPTFSISGLIGCSFPQSTVFVDAASSTYLASCLYVFLSLAETYLGGRTPMWQVIGEGQTLMRFYTFPICCLFVCIPHRPLTRYSYVGLRCLVLQVCVIRPVSALCTVFVMLYAHTDPRVKAAYPSISLALGTLGILSTLLALYGVTLLKTALSDSLGGLALGPKLASIQLVILTAAILLPVIRVLVFYDVIPCNPHCLPYDVADSIYRITLVPTLLLFSVFGRWAFCRASDVSFRPQTFSATHQGLPEKPNWRARLLQMLPQRLRTLMRPSHQTSFYRRPESPFRSDSDG